MVSPICTPSTPSQHYVKINFILEQMPGALHCCGYRKYMLETGKGRQPQNIAFFK